MEEGEGEDETREELKSGYRMGRDRPPSIFVGNAIPRDGMDDWDVSDYGSVDNQDTSSVVCTICYKG